jgi:threonine/homoserine/homoserine lactone efflux protein
VFGPDTAGKISGARAAGNGWNYFIYAFLLTISNPITIIFWSGIFTMKISGAAYSKSGLYFFALGAAASTFVFLTLVSLLGALMNFYFPPLAVKLLNFSVGAAIIIFGIIFFRKKTL